MLPQVPVAVLFLAAASVTLSGILAFVHLRHVGLALLTALAPLPGLALAAGFARHVSVSDLAAVYGLGIVAGALLGGWVEQTVLGERLEGAWLRGLRAGVPIAVAAVAVMALLVGWMFRDARAAGLGVAVAVGAGVLPVILIVPLAGLALPFGESFFVRVNHAREAREGWLRLATLTTERRWGMSLLGVALVLAVLGWFGAEPLVRHSAFLGQKALWAASALGVFAVAFAVARDWREALAALLTLGAFGIVALWLWGRAVGHVPASAFVAPAVVAGVALLPMLALMDRARLHRAAGDMASIARLRAVEETGAAILFGTLGSAVAMAPWVLMHGANGVVAMLMLLAGAAALLGQPALATALEGIVPRRRSVDQLYGRG